MQVTSTTEECPAEFNSNTSSIIAANFPNAYRGENGTFYLTPSTTVSPSINHKSTNKYKSSIMEKYLRDLSEIDPESEPANNDCSTSPNPFQQMVAQSQSNLAPVAPMSCETRGPPSLSKWLESTAKFTPSKNNYIDWDQPGFVRRLFLVQELVNIQSFSLSPRRPSTSKKRCHSNSFHQHQPSDEEGHHRATSQPPQETDDSGEFGIHQKDEIDAAEALTRLANNFRMKFYT